MRPRGLGGARSPMAPAARKGSVSPGLRAPQPAHRNGCPENRRHGRGVPKRWFFEAAHVRRLPGTVAGVPATSRGQVRRCATDACNRHQNRAGPATGQDIREVEHAGPGQNCKWAAALLNCRAAQPRLPQLVEPRQGTDRPPMEVLQLCAGTRQKLADVKSTPVDRGKRCKSHRLLQEPEKPRRQNH